MYYKNRVVTSTRRPREVEVTPTAVYIRKNISEKVGEGEEGTYFEYLEDKSCKNETLLSTLQINDSLGKEIVKIKMKEKEQENLINSLGKEVVSLRIKMSELK